MIEKQLAITALFLRLWFISGSSKPYEVDLPPEHMAFYFNNNPSVADDCRRDIKCPYKMHLNLPACWGYEPNCTQRGYYMVPSCPGDSLGWTKTKEEQIDAFFVEGDFGYIKERKKEIQLLCDGNNQESSHLACSKYTRYCVSRNIWFSFKTLASLPEPMRYREDVIRSGEIGGHCNLNKIALAKEGTQKSPLQSWYAELEHFTELPKPPIEDEICDIVISKPAIIMKLDATVSMYHHFCDFFNLYATLHMNNTFHTDIQIVIWDTLPYYSNFEVMWKVFTKHPVLTLHGFKGKRVCFKDLVFPLLPRMIFGMYYNMPLVPGCHSSGLFHAFNRHVLHKLKVQQEHSVGGKLRITFLSRGTQYRKIINENELIQSLQIYPDFIVKRVDYNRNIPFIEQLKITQNSDIFIGMHGSGLTHLLFLPDWASIIELYNCEDENCYKDLARLRGVSYFTWEKSDKIYPADKGHHPTLGAHAKFTNYAFDVDEFLNLVNKAAQSVRDHISWQQAYQEHHNLIHNEL